MIVVIANCSPETQDANLLIDWSKLGMNKENVTVTALTIQDYQVGFDMANLENVKVARSQGLIVSIKAIVSFYVIVSQFDVD